MLARAHTDDGSKPCLRFVPVALSRSLVRLYHVCSCCNALPLTSHTLCFVVDIGHYARACPTMGRVLVVPFVVPPHSHAYAEDGHIRAEAFRSISCSHR